ncbi:MAG: DNA polymerase III subunit delta [Bacteroidales bacterium]|nr:DNA polymerase III subunit delta [Bacteroidales bacterium]
MTYEKIIDDFKKKIYVPVYLLMGENAYHIDKITHFIQENFFEDEGVKEFNMDILYGKDSSVDQIVSLAKQYPMMSNYRLVIIKEAQSIAKIADLAPYVQNPQKQTVLLLCYKYKSLDKRTLLYKAIDKMGGVFESPKIYDNQVSKYVKEIAAEKKFIIDNYTAELIASHIGTDLSRVDNEFNKFKNIIKEGASITPELVQEYIGISKEYNDFELVNAIWAKNAPKAYEIIYHFQSNPKAYPIQKTIAVLYNSFMKLVHYHFSANKSNLKQYNVFTAEAEKAFRYATTAYPYPIIMRIIHLLRMYDLKSKGFENCDTPDQELLKELTFRIIEGRYEG